MTKEETAVPTTGSSVHVRGYQQTDTGAYCVSLGFDGLDAEIELDVEGALKVATMLVQTVKAIEARRVPVGRTAAA